ncbi:MAG: AAA family ATPase [Candidatus Heimdallarchaeaceae archaeon]
MTKRRERKRSKEEKFDLCKKYRPNSLDEFYGNSSLKRTLRKAIKDNRVSHTILLEGDRGCLRGDVEIYDPVNESNLTIEERWKKGESFNVFSYDASNEGEMKVAQAMPPVQYPATDLFLVETSEYSSFCVTGKHQFLLGTGEYLSLRELFAQKFSDVPLLSILESSLNVPLQDRFRYWRMDALKKQFHMANIKKITPVCQAKYYDFHVPVYNNYWAKGLIHHNCGKTSIGRILAKELDCSRLDFREIDVADFSGIDTARQIRRTMYTSPMKGKVKVFLLDEIALLGQGGASEKNKAQSALLKAFEEPPKHCYFIACTTDPQNVLTTIKSRCTRYKVSPLSPQKVVTLITDIAMKEGVKLPKKVAFRIAKESQGHPREAIKMLEQVIFLSEEEMLEITFEMNQSDSDVKELINCIWYGKSWKETASVLRKLKDEPEGVRRKVRGYFTGILLNGDQRAYIVVDIFKQPFFNTDAKNELVRCTFESWSELNE